MNSSFRETARAWLRANLPREFPDFASRVSFEQDLFRGQAGIGTAPPASLEKRGDARAEGEKTVRVRRIGAIDQLPRVLQQLRRLAPGERSPIVI